MLQDTDHVSVQGRNSKQRLKRIFIAKQII